VLRIVYAEVQHNYRHLSDIRFRLLGFVPAVSVVAWATLLTLITDPGGMLLPIEAVAGGCMICLLGLAITLGLKIYDTRNDQLYNDLISRGRKIEEELGIHTGVFRGRVRGGAIINHGVGLNLVYGSVIFGWLVFAGWLAWKGWSL
jgi:hypothetical protein